MWLTTTLLALAMAAPSGAAASHPAKVEEPIKLHSGVPGKAYLGQPLAEFLSHFPTAKSEPFARQSDVVRLQVANEGISALAMGATPATMTIESLGFNFEGTYEGVSAGKRRTAEGIGPDSTVNDVLGTYGKPSETASEKHKGTISAQRITGTPTPPDPAEPTRYVYKSADGAVVTYFVVKDAMVQRMVMNRLESIRKYLMSSPQEKDAPAKGGDQPAAPAEHP